MTKDEAMCRDYFSVVVQTELMPRVVHACI